MARVGDQVTAASPGVAFEMVGRVGEVVGYGNGDMLLVDYGDTLFSVHPQHLHGPRARYCETCKAGPLRQGFYVGEEYYCDDHEPAGYEYTDDGDDYWTEWDESEDYEEEDY